MQVLAAEARFAVADPAVIEVADAALDAERAVSGTLAVEAEDQAHDLRFRRIDLQPLLHLVAACLRRECAIAQGRARPIPEALPRILLHRPKRVLGVLLALVLIEHGEDLARNAAGRVVAGPLRDGDDSHAVILKPPARELKFLGAAERQ